MVRMRPVTREILLDLVTSGLVAGLFLLVALYSTSPQGRGLETLFAGAGLLFIVAGFLSGVSRLDYSGLRAFILASVFVIFFAFVRPIPDTKLVILSLIAYGSSLAGIYSCRAWGKGNKWRAAFILGTVFAAIEVSAVLGAPAIARWLTT